MRLTLIEAKDLRYYTPECIKEGEDCIMGKILDLYSFEGGMYAIRACKKCQMIRVFHAIFEQDREEDDSIIQVTEKGNSPPPPIDTQDPVIGADSKNKRS